MSTRTDGPPSTRIDLLRHGEPVGGSRYRGQLDDPLSERGWRQMRAAVAGRSGWEVVVSSDLSRCAEFAREVAAERGAPLEFDAGFREIAFGRWEGRSAAQLLESDGDALRAFWRDPVHATPPEAEPLAAFHARVTAAWERLLERHPGRHLLLVGHAGMMRMVLLHLLGLPLEAFYRFEPGNASLVSVRIDSGRHGERFPQLLFPAPEGI